MTEGAAEEVDVDELVCIAVRSEKLSESLRIVSGYAFALEAFGGRGRRFVAGPMYVEETSLGLGIRVGGPGEAIVDLELALAC